MTCDDAQLWLMELNSLDARIVVLEYRFGVDDPEVAALRRDYMRHARLVYTALVAGDAPSTATMVH